MIHMSTVDRFNFCFQALEDHEIEKFFHEELWISEKFKVSVNIGNYAML